MALRGAGKSQSVARQARRDSVHIEKVFKSPPTGALVLPVHDVTGFKSASQSLYPTGVCVFCVWL